jgi:putative thiamine transport system permease protein
MSPFATRPHWSAVPLALLFMVPLALSLALVFPLLWSAEALEAALSHPQFAGGLWLSLWTATCSTALALVAAVLIVATAQPERRTGFYLAVPHLAFAIGLAFLIMPSGLLLRLIAQFANWTAPPQIVTTQDPYGFALITALVLKEIPFLVFVLLALLQRDDLKQQFQGQIRVAKSLGHGSFSIWTTLLLPQLLPRLQWPLMAVLVYGATVVDMALVIGPAQPPTLAAIIWTDLNDGEATHNLRGGALALILTAALFMLVYVVSILTRLAAPYEGFYSSKGPDTRNLPKWPGAALEWLLAVVYGLVVAVLVIMSASGLWPFPDLLPQQFSTLAWQNAFSDLTPAATSLALAFSTSVTATTISIIWLEWQPQAFDSLALLFCGLMLCVPILLIALGQYRLLLQFGLTGTWTGLYFAHLLPVTAYVFIMLHGPYRGFDPRWHRVAAGLQSPRLRFLWQIKWPLLRAPVFAAMAVGFAVSIGQFVPAQLAAAGRFSSLPMEAVTLASGGNRALTATYALLLMVMPLAGFSLAQIFGRPRWVIPHA